MIWCPNSTSISQSDFFLLVDAWDCGSVLVQLCDGLAFFRSLSQYRADRVQLNYKSVTNSTQTFAVDTTRSTPHEMQLLESASNYLLLRFVKYRVKWLPSFGSLLLRSSFEWWKQKRGRGLYPDRFCLRRAFPCTFWTTRRLPLWQWNTQRQGTKEVA